MDTPSEQTSKPIVVPRLEPVIWPISDLKLPKRRLRKHSDTQIGQIAASISQFGFIVPVLTSKDGEIIAGEARVSAATTCGMTHVPAVLIEHLTPAQIRQFRIADNKLAENADWNDKELRLELGELILDDPDLNFEAMGFSLPEFDIALIDASSQSDAELIAEDLEPPGPAISQPGDVFSVDGHTVVCGNSLEARVYQEALGGEAPAVVFADGPFNVSVKSHVGGRGRIKHREFVMASGEMTSDDFQNFQTNWLSEVAAVMPAGALLYVCIDWRGLHATLQAAKDAGFVLINLVAWFKTGAGLGSLYRSQHELVLVLRKPGAGHRNNIELGKHGRWRSNAWTYAGANVAGATRKVLALHPTPKPVEMVADILLDCTTRKDIVLDPFGGSGTTLIAAQRVGRRARIIELDPLYVDVIIRRYARTYGRDFIHVQSGLLLDALGQTRSQQAPRLRARHRRGKSA